MKNDNSQLTETLNAIGEKALEIRAIDDIKKIHQIAGEIEAMSRYKVNISPKG